MFGFMKQIFVSAMFFACNLSGVNPLEFASMNNQECKIRPEIVNFNSDDPAFHPFSIKTSKCSDTCSNINDPYAKLFDPHAVKNVNVKVFNLMSRTN